VSDGKVSAVSEWNVQRKQMEQMEQMDFPEKAEI
jgi:hypothetical protein